MGQCEGEAGLHKMDFLGLNNLDIISDIITEPKTSKSNRVITMPDFLCDELRDYLDQIYDKVPDSRIFPLTKHMVSCCHSRVNYDHDTSFCGLLLRPTLPISS